LLLLALSMSYRIAMRGEGEIAALGFGLLASLIGWIIHNQVNHTAPFTESTLWVLFGLLLAAYYQMQRQSELAAKSATPPSSPAPTRGRQPARSR
jgi:uncharacterized membrane protein YfcA